MVQLTHNKKYYLKYTLNGITRKGNKKEGTQQNKFICHVPVIKCLNH